MTTATSENVAASRRLFVLADSLRAERDNWRGRGVRRNLERAARQMEAAARETLSLGQPFAEAWETAGALYRDVHVAHRRAIVASGGFTPYRKRLRPVLSLDCLGGIHGGCALCDCRCHDRQAQ